MDCNQCDFSSCTAGCKALIAQLAERDEEIARLQQQSVGWVAVFDENITLREEVERLRLENRQMLQQMKWDKQNIELGRKQAAQDIVDMLRSDRWAESELKEIIEKFGLEG